MMNFAGGALLEATTSYIVQKLADFGVARCQQFLEIANDINSIKGELSMMKAILKDAERRMETSEAFNEWAKQLKNVAFMIEDFMDEYVYAEQGFHAGDSSCSDKVQNFNWQLVPRLEATKNEVATISRRGQAYGLHLTQSFGHGCKQDEGESSRAILHRPVYSPPFEEIDIVGFDDDVRKLMDWLLTEEERRWSIMSIVGMGGSGKTTLAKKVYSLIHNHFDHHFWVSVSQYSPSKLKDFLRDIVELLYYKRERRKQGRLRQRFTRCQSIRVHDPQQSMRNLLDKKRYVIFLDDIKDIDFWKALEDALPREGRGKIIFTSREKITNFLLNGNCHVHMLNPLPFELAWDLFCRNAFQNYTLPISCPSYLNELAAAIVRSCCGLPLAIVLMGRLMSKEGNSPKKWKDVVDHFDQELLHNPGLQCLNWILQATYNHLPSQLKYCFLYCCLFPKHHRIKRKKITQMWVAQGFVEKQGGKVLEDVADDYFIQLIERSFLQPIISEFTGEVIACNVHEIMHNFAIGKSPKEFGIITKEPCNECEQKRLLALQNYGIPCERQHGKARSFLFFDFTATFSDCQMNKLLGHKFLMVLCLDGMVIKELPSELGDLLHLRYLSLKGTKIVAFPDSLGKLYNLETLDARNTRIKSIPTTIVNLRDIYFLVT